MHRLVQTAMTKRSMGILFGSNKPVMPVWFHLFREMYRLHRHTYPPSQLQETNKILKDIFRDYIQKFKTECTTFEERELLIEEAKERAVAYTESLRQMSFGGSERVQLHSGDYWERIYQNILSEYVQAREQNESLKIDEFLQSVKHLQRDWYGSFDVLKPYLNPLMKDMPKDASILVLGVGLSTLPIHLYEMGFTNITCTDISQTCCEMMALNVTQTLGKQALSSIKYLAMDMKDMSSFPPNSFDVVIDKAVLDSLYMEGDEESYQEGVLDKGIQNVRSVQEQVLHVLKKNCKWIVFSQYDYSLEPESQEDDDLIAFDTTKCQNVDAQHDNDENFYIYTIQK